MGTTLDTGRGKWTVPMLVLTLLIAGCAKGEGAEVPPTSVPTLPGGDDAIAPIQQETKVGILVRDDGDLVEYNATTFRLIRDYLSAKWARIGLPPELLLVDHGRYFLDAAHPFDAAPHASPLLRDVWAQPYDGGAVPVTDPMRAIWTQHVLPEGATYLASGEQVRYPDWSTLFSPAEGVFYFNNEEDLRGKRMPDVIEILALAMYREWLSMNNHNPSYDQGRLIHDFVLAKLRQQLGANVPIRVAHGLDPEMRPGESLDDAVKSFVTDGVNVIIDAYQPSLGFSIVDTCLHQAQLEAALASAGFAGQVVRTEAAGLRSEWAEGTAAYAEWRIGALPAAGRMAVYLVQEGTDAALCPAADASESAAKAQFDLNSAALQETIARDGLILRQVYAQNSNQSDDGRLSPWEALEYDMKYATSNVVMIPFESWTDGVVPLARLRTAAGVHPPGALYDSSHETAFEYRNAKVTITSAYFSPGERANAYLATIVDALEEARR
jgi:hypothetical protein